MSELASLLDSLGRPRILVVGDLILDRYTWGNAERVSPEAPVPVLRADLHEVRLGGAASVAALLRALDADVKLAGVRGEDGDGRILVRLLEEAGVESSAVLLEQDRPTTTKERFMGRAGDRHPQQILRVDRESREPLRSETTTRLISLLSDLVRDVQAVLVSDYGKGVGTAELLTALRTVTRDQGLPLLIDPARQPSCERYRGADLLKPNRAQAELATSRKIHSPEDGLAAGQALCQQFGLGAALITLDRDGMVLSRGEGPGEWFPTQARTVYDITGAGDMVLAMVGLCWASGLGLEAAARLANVAAGLEVERLGVAPLRRSEVRAALSERPPARSKIVTLAELLPLAEQWRRAGQTVVFTNGCFDLLHIGHVSYLQDAARLGTILVVGLNSDRSVRALKGPERPIVPESERAALLAALEGIDRVVIFDDNTPLQLIRQLRPDILVKGGTYTVEEVVGREVVQAYGGRVCVTGQVEGHSTTRLLTRLRGNDSL